MIFVYFKRVLGYLAIMDQIALFINTKILRGQFVTWPNQENKLDQRRYVSDPKKMLKGFPILLLSCSFCNGLVFQFDGAPMYFMDILIQFNYVFTLLFTIECVLKLSSFGLKVRKLFFLRNFFFVI